MDPGSKEEDSIPSESTVLVGSRDWAAALVCNRVDKGPVGTA